MLLLKFPGKHRMTTQREEHVRFVMKFQQCTGPITAKGIEDTAFYIYNRLAALNEVGGEPDHFGGDAGSFSQTKRRAAADFPHAMLATSTHDTKRSRGHPRAHCRAFRKCPRNGARTMQRCRTINRKHKRRSRRRIRAGCERGISPLPDAARRVAAASALARGA